MARALDRCLVCGGSLDQTVELRDGYRVLFCGVCRLGHLVPRPSPSAIAALYSGDYFEHEAADSPGYAEYEAMESEHRQAARMLLGQIARFGRPPGRLFDVGCGFGYFLQEAKEAGWTVAGSDLSPAAASNAAARVGNVVRQSIEDIDGSYDVITAWDVVEHVQDPLIAFQRVHAALAPGGVFAFTTPDTGSWDAVLLRQKWYGYTKVPEHLLYFNRSSVRALLDRSGLELALLRGWGFVRTLGFVTNQLGRTLLGRPVAVADRLPGKLRELPLFIPAIDLLAVARRSG